MERPPRNPRNAKKLLVLPFEASIVGIFLLVLLGAFYVVITLSSLIFIFTFLLNHRQLSSLKNVYPFSYVMWTTFVIF